MGLGVLSGGNTVVLIGSGCGASVGAGTPVGCGSIAN